MRNMKLLSFTSIVLFFALVLSGALNILACAGYREDDRPRCYLIVGFDDAANNADVISLLRTDCASAKLDMVQIPRDTYFGVGSYQNKINQVISFFKGREMSVAEAVGAFSDILSEALSLKIDAYITFKTSDVVDLVDAMGGIYVEVSQAEIARLSGVELSLSVGENRLDGRQALKLIRHRSSYTGGDLSRLEVQRIVLRGLLNTALNRLDAITLLRVVNQMRSKVQNSISLADVMYIVGNRNCFKGALLDARILPGESIRADTGVWYYVVKRRATSELISEMSGNSDVRIDPKGYFLNSACKPFSSIYYQ